MKRKKIAILFLSLCLVITGFFIYRSMFRQKEVTYYYGTDTLKDSAYEDTNQPTLNKTVSADAREKYTTLLKGGKDTVTVMFYMIAQQDRESEYKNTINNIVYANDSPNVNVLIETGASSSFQSSVLKDDAIQRWTAQEDTPVCLDEQLPFESMCDPAALQEFLEYGFTSYPASRYMLVLSGEGSPDAFGYDPSEHFTSLSYDSIADILSGFEEKLDLICFDSPYAGTFENAMRFEPYADYMTAFESQIDVSGLLYQSFLSKLAENTSSSTLNLGKLLIDSYVLNHAQKKMSVPYVLSLIDLSEIRSIAEKELCAFSDELAENLKNGVYQTIADVAASAQTVESRLYPDNLDLAHFVRRFSLSSSQDLFSAVTSAVKYRRTMNMSNTYGLSFCFPYNNLKTVSTLYPEPFRQFTSLFALYTGLSHVEASLTSLSLSDVLSGAPQETAPELTMDDLLNAQRLAEYGVSLSDFDEETARTAAQYVLDHQISSDLSLTRDGNDIVCPLTRTDISMVHNMQKKLFIYQDPVILCLGSDMDIDHTYEGEPIVTSDHTWYFYRNQPIPFVPVSGCLSPDIIGAARALCNGEEVYLLIERKAFSFTPSFAGMVRIQKGTDVQEKGILPISAEDRFSFLYESYDISGQFLGYQKYGFSFTIRQEDHITSDTFDMPVVSTLMIQDFYHNTRYTPLLSDAEFSSQ
ncbi:MAG: clostripain-related cysteine peptidase [Bulleidia sp.]